MLLESMTISNDHDMFMEILDLCSILKVSSRQRQKPGNAIILVKILTQLWMILDDFVVLFL
ncbi:hypothetical protein FH966_03770 [Lentibacillus cibarius]|uniref:Uncharacterized protein n=1 Tax=Lentibacillus cibarius TaxID=2583219 RepID=A0A549YGD1_9BACI|nr:hypothetical protein [Lentibacillus cibarius]TRM10908.1 hypothetical protein FH966_03770 [Lentibacillus cibarius]